MNPIPNTDLSVSPITLGTMTYGNPVAFDDAVDLTRYALAQGINMIDTANMYEGYDRVPGSAGGVAERIIGRAIQGLDRRGVLIATKLGMKVGDSPEDAGTSAAAVHTQLSRSLERLGTDYVDLYYLHCPDPSVPLEETLRAIDEELRRGRIRYYGVSNYSAGQLAALLAAADQNGLPRPAEPAETGGSGGAAAPVPEGEHRRHPLPDLPGRAPHREVPPGRGHARRLPGGGDARLAHGPGRRPLRQAGGDPAAGGRTGHVHVPLRPALGAGAARRGLRHRWREAPGADRQRPGRPGLIVTYL